MARDGSDPDDLVLPFIFVPHGDPVPVEWLAQHPGAIRIPASFVPNQSGERPQLQFDPSAALLGGTAELADVKTASHDAPTDLQSLHQERSSYAAAPPPIRPPAPNQPLQNGHASGAATMTPFASMSGRKPAIASADHIAVDDNMTAQERIEPVLFVDDRGRAVIGAKNKPVQRPRGLDPHLFVRQGLEDAKIVKVLRAADKILVMDTTHSLDLAADALLARRLVNFAWFMAWDAQRIRFKHHREYEDYSTIAIGLYAAAAGFSREGY